MTHNVFTSNFAKHLTNQFMEASCSESIGSAEINMLDIVLNLIEDDKDDVEFFPYSGGMPFSAFSIIRQARNITDIALPESFSNGEEREFSQEQYEKLYLIAEFLGTEDSLTYTYDIAVASANILLSEFGDYKNQILHYRVLRPGDTEPAMCSILMQP